MQLHLPHKLSVGGKRLPLRTSSRVVTGKYWTGSPKQSIDQKGNNCPKNVRKLCFQPLRTFFGHVWTFFRHFVDIFLDILSTFPFSRAVQRFARYKSRAILCAARHAVWLHEQGSDRRRLRKGPHHSQDPQHLRSQLVMFCLSFSLSLSSLR